MLLLVFRINKLKILIIYFFLNAFSCILLFFMCKFQINLSTGDQVSEARIDIVQ